MLSKTADVVEQKGDSLGSAGRCVVLLSGPLRNKCRDGIRMVPFGENNSNSLELKFARQKRA